MSSPFASFTQQTIELPFDAQHTVTIRKLSAKQIAKARDVSRLASMALLKEMGGDMQGQLAALGDAETTAALVEAAKADPLNTVDTTTVLRFGVTAWTYDATVCEETIEDLTEEAAEFIARAIVALTLPPSGELERKKG